MVVVVAVFWDVMTESYCTAVSEERTARCCCCCTVAMSNFCNFWSWADFGNWAVYRDVSTLLSREYSRMRTLNTANGDIKHRSESCLRTCLSLDVTQGCPTIRLWCVRKEMQNAPRPSVRPYVCPPVVTCTSSTCKEGCKEMFNWQVLLKCTATFGVR